MMYAFDVKGILEDVPDDDAMEAIVDDVTEALTEAGADNLSVYGSITQRTMAAEYTVDAPSLMAAAQRGNELRRLAQSRLMAAGVRICPTQPEIQP